MNISGGCLCGAVRYQSTTAPFIARMCWCRLCQYLGAGTGTASAGFRTDSFSIEGETTDYVSVADSGNRMHRRFCPKCGTPLFSSAEARPLQIFVRIGTLDDPELIKPSMIIWTASAPSWACLGSELPQLPGQPPPPIAPTPSAD